MKNAEKAAFPTTEQCCPPFSEGLTKIEYASIKAMQAMLSNKNLYYLDVIKEKLSIDKEILVAMSIEYAKELLKQLESEK